MKGREEKEHVGAEFPGIFQQILMAQSETGTSKVYTVLGGKDFRTSSTHLFYLTYITAHLVLLPVVLSIELLTFYATLFWGISCSQRFAARFPCTPF